VVCSSNKIAQLWQDSTASNITSLRVQVHALQRMEEGNSWVRHPPNLRKDPLPKKSLLQKQLYIIIAWQASLLDIF
jgi:hypothetical protein